MSIFSKKDRTRVTADNAGFFDFESEVLQEDEYAWSWTVARAFTEAFEAKFQKKIRLQAVYEKDLLGSCSSGVVTLRPTLRGSEAWRTLFHELAHALTPGAPEEQQHGKEWQASLVVVHDFWKEFLRGCAGELKTRVIEMVTNYGFWRGRPIGLDENTDPWNRPWVNRR